MHWALPLLIALVAIVWSYLFFRRNLAVARRAQARADLLTAALGQSPAVVGVTDLEGNLQYVNPAFETASGYTAAELLGQNPRVLKSGVTPDEHYRHLWETITAGQVWVSELCNKRKDGQLYWEWASIAPVTDRRGKISHYVKVAEDITARKRADAARQESEKRFRSIFELAGAGMALVDRQACTGCGDCVAICPYDACSLEADQGAYKSTVNQMRCTGCGSCVSVCPNGSIQLPEHNALLIGEMLKAAFS